MTGRLLLTDLPQRQPRRISNLDFPAVAISSPKAISNGLAGNPHTREATPIHPGLVSLPGSQSVLDTPDAAAQPGLSSLRRAPRGSVLGRCRIFVLSLTQRCKPGSDALREISKSLPVIGFHVPKHGEADEQDVAENQRGLANVCS